MANELITGTVIVRLDGVSIRSKAGAKMSMGGEERTMVYADGKPVGYTAKPVGSTVSATLVHTSLSDLDALRNTTDATLIFECDSGPKYTIRDAFLTKPPELSDGEGGVAVEFMGHEAVQTS